mgnify:FL=1
MGEYSQSTELKKEFPTVGSYISYLFKKIASEHTEKENTTNIVEPEEKLEDSTSFMQ